MQYIKFGIWEKNHFQDQIQEDFEIEEYQDLKNGKIFLKLMGDDFTSNQSKKDDWEFGFKGYD